jgi:hypothetical protein
VETVGPRRTIRELIAELAELEDRLRALDHSSGSGALGPERLELARRQRTVIAALRRHQLPR